MFCGSLIWIKPHHSCECWCKFCRRWRPFQTLPDHPSIHNASALIYHTHTQHCWSNIDITLTPKWVDMHHVWLILQQCHESFSHLFLSVRSDGLPWLLYACFNLRTITGDLSTLNREESEYKGNRGAKASFHVVLSLVLTSGSFSFKGAFFINNC